MEKNTRQKSIWQTPLLRILLGLLVCFIAFILAQQSGRILELTRLDKNYRNLLKGIISSAAVILTYIWFFGRIEKRKIVEFSNRGLIKNILIGTLIGGLLQCLTLLVILFAGSFEIVRINPFSSLVIPFTVAFSVAIFEEILIRGILFRIIEEKLGSYFALLISAVIFGALHLANPNSTLLSGICVGIEAGLLMGAAYIYKRNLWFPIAIHFAWNFMQSGVFGAVTSGNENSSSLMTTKISGNDFITGGAFGPEGTVQAIVFCVMAALLLLRLGKNKIVKPFWRHEIE